MNATSTTTTSASPSSTQRSVLSITSILVLAAIVIFVNGISSVALRRMYVDLTEDGLYSLSEGTKNVLASIDEPITLKFYYSRTDSSEFPTLRLYGSRISDLLREYERLGKGKIVLEIHDPRPDSEEEEWAEKYGLTPMQLQTGSTLFLGLAGVNGQGTEQTIPLFNFQRQEFLEYDVTKLVYSLIKGAKPTVGILSSLNIRGSASPYPMPGMEQQQEEAWFFVSQLEGLVNVKHLDKTVSDIEDGIDVLLVIHPKNFSAETLYAIDQFVMRGGRLFVLVDPYCQADNAAAADPQNPMAAMTAERNSNLNQLLEKWGVRQIDKKAVADINLATRVNAGQMGAVKDFVLWLSLTKNNFNRDDVSTSALDQMLLPWAAPLELVQKDGIKAEKLLESSPSAMLIDEKDYRFRGGDPDTLLRTYSGGEKAQLLAVRLAGKFQSNYPEGKPASTAEVKPDAQNQSSAHQHLKESTAETSVVVIGDVDFVSDQYSLIAQSLFGRKFVTLINQNLVFLQNTIENLTGSNDLISIRSRGRFSRPFTVVEQIEREAAMRWQQEEAVLQARLNDANQRLQRLQTSASQQQSGSSQQVFSKAVLDEMKKFRDDRNEAQRKLREVRRNLRQDKEQLGTSLFLLNTFGVPLLLIAAAIYSYSRRRKALGAARKNA